MLPVDDRAPPLAFRQIIERREGGLYALTEDGCRILRWDGEWWDITPLPERIRRGEL